jgi:hypothetical protein
MQNFDGESISVWKDNIKVRSKGGHEDGQWVEMTQDH